MTCLCIVLGNYQRCSTNSLLPLSRHFIAKVIRYSYDGEDNTYDDYDWEA